MGWSPGGNPERDPLAKLDHRATEQPPPRSRVPHGRRRGNTAGSRETGLPSRVGTSFSTPRPTALRRVAVVPSRVRPVAKLRKPRRHAVMPTEECG